MDMRQTDLPFVLKILRKDFSIWRFLVELRFPMLDLRFVLESY